MLTNKQAHHNLSRLKDSFNNAKEEALNIRKNDATEYDEKIKQFDELEKKCIATTLNNNDIDKSFIIGIHSLLKEYKSGTPGKINAYKGFLLKYVDGDVEDLLDYMERDLYNVYYHNIKHKILLVDIEAGKLKY